MYQNQLVIRGAQQHNLKNIDVVIPRHKLVVITGVSGSGKSSLAFDTLYAEGQRRYVESLSSYARQFLGQMDKPRVDFVGGLSPAIAIEQKAVSKNPRSTVGTVTEIYDYLRVLFARVGTPHCPKCGREVYAQSAQQIVDQIRQVPPGTRFQVLAPVVRGRKGTHEDLLEALRGEGYVRARIDGVPSELSERIALAKTKKHDIEIVVDRLVVPDPRIESAGGVASPGHEDREPESGDFLVRLADSVETALELAEGLLYVDILDGELLTFSEQNACPDCGVSFPNLTPQLFSFNSPYGMCPDCNGLGSKVEFHPDLFVDPELTIGQGAVRTWGELNKKRSSGTWQAAKQILEQFGHSLNTRWSDLSTECQNAILYGGVTVTWKSESDRGKWQGQWESEGVVNATRRRYHQTGSEYMRRWYMTFMRQQPCPTCQGRRLRPEATATTIAGRDIHRVTHWSVREALDWVNSLWPDHALDGRSRASAQASLAADESALSPEQFQIAEEVLKEIRDRLQFMLNVGLHYLTLDRSAPTLSGGEGQRIRLASQVGCGLVGVLYILDEPSIGLHQRDNRRLLDTLEQLRDLGNTVLVVEHDAETMLTADWLIDLGPGAGVRGGRVVAEGTPQAVMNNQESLTGSYLAGRLVVTSPNGRRRPANGQWLALLGARQNNLKNLDVRFPLGLFTCVTGVSGSGKSSLVSQTLYPALARTLHRSKEDIGEHDRLEGLEAVDKVVNITQDPIGRTPRSNPATYTKVFDDIRAIFAQVPEAKARGYKGGRFSFNVKGGRCEACKGHGQKKIEMHFLPDVWVRCDICRGTRYNRETLQIRYKGRNIAETLDMDVNEALGHFENIPVIQRKLQTLVDVGLGYVKLGQSATTLSGGEAQRVKLSKELSRVSTGDTVYILDEPTTGLHFSDIQKLLDVLHRLTDAGNTVIVIEHNLDVIKTADWIVDLGPEGGDGGGQIVAQGTPEELSLAPASYTGQFLKSVLQGRGSGGIVQLKDMFDANAIDVMASALERAHPTFDRKEFIHRVFDASWEDLALKARVRHISTVLGSLLPRDYRLALDVLRRALPMLEGVGFVKMVLPDYVELYGLDDWQSSIPALEDLTQAISAEFAIRPFIARYPDRTMAQMLAWAGHTSPEVRRLASEGCRPRLPWGIRLTGLVADPSPILPILERLRNDESESVRNSVANNLNDISKDHPQLVLDVLSRWQATETPETRWITNHALRTLLKAGLPQALELLGYTAAPAIAVHNLSLEPPAIDMGDEIALSFDVESLSDEPVNLMIDYVVYHLRANGQLSPKVFKLTKRSLEPHQVISIAKSHSFAPVTTRRYYPGEHAIEPQINGTTFGRMTFMLGNDAGEKRIGLGGVV